MESLVERAQKGDTAASEELVRQFEPVVHRIARKLFLPGGERQDLWQEGYLGLASAIRNYRPGSNLSFSDYAEMSIRNGMLHAIRRANSKKGQLLNAAQSIDVEPAGSGDVVDQVCGKLVFSQILGFLKNKLSNVELAVMSERASGMSVHEVAHLHHLNDRQVENAYFRARQKARQAYQLAAVP